jgi:hypothetical protein
MVMQGIVNYRFVKNRKGEVANLFLTWPQTTAHKTKETKKSIGFVKNFHSSREGVM